MEQRGSEVGGNSRIARNTVILVTMRVLVPLLSVGLMLVLSRRLGVDGIGRYTLAYGYLYLFNTIAPLGLVPVITRDGARHRDRLAGILANAFSLGTACSLVLGVVMALLGRPMGYDPQTQAALGLLAVAILPFTLGEFVQGACVAIERADYVAAATLTEYGFKVGLGIVLLLNGYGLEAVLASAVVGRILGCAVGAYLLRRSGIRVGWGWDPSTLRELGSLAPTFLSIAVFATLYWRIDILMLSRLRPIESVGLYGAAWRLLEFAMVIPTSLCLAIYPRVAVLIDDEPQKLAALARTAMRYLFALTLPIAVCVTLLGDRLLALTYGEPFARAALTLTVLIWALLPYNLVRYHAYVLVAANRQRIDLLLNVVMSILNVLLNFVLISRYGHLGAAAATLVAICTYAVLQQLYLRKYLQDRAVPPVVQPVVLVAALATGAMVWSASSRPLVAMAIAPVVYFTILVAGRFFTTDELALFGVGRSR